MSKPGPSQSSLLDLKALTAENADRLAKEGKRYTKGAPRPPTTSSQVASKDPFNRPSPGLVKRLAQQARSDAKRRVFSDTDGVDEDTRRAIMEQKARRYEQLAKGDFSGMSEREMAEAAIDFEAKAAGDWSDHSSDVNESAAPGRRWDDGDRDAPDFDTFNDREIVEYVDELGRTRTGTRKEAREAERAAGRGRSRDDEERRDTGSSYTQVMESRFIHGDQGYFPVYQPDPEELKRKYLESEREARAHHYDSTKEVRIRGAGAYQFSLDDEQRAAQMRSLDATRAETDAARAKRSGGATSSAQEAKKRKMAERAALVEAKRNKLLGGAGNVARMREEKRAREADNLLAELEGEIDNSKKDKV
ncbi:uncharacterized protein EHS24_004816 [Apiotrichum porosum]|uniref:Coiled-coil domain-containing protein 174 n=1 Tax=Apiotrichum porosum TaxID=105984 RepID=A0A427Y634_9TREE|nr:uncharacterized protein EHS24_004816 [Apiotrichum porosum]RSH86548.1 hypothetical protein EHS24_004816 [Apiotrichum porosum]